MHSCLALRAAALMISFAIGACTLEPPYARPPGPVEERWSGSAAPTASGLAIPADAIGWRAFFTDPAMQRLIEISLANNRDARIAAINVAAARAQYRIQRAELFPKIDVTAQEDVERVPLSESLTGQTISRVYSVGVGFTSFELDFFGRIRSLDHQKLQQYLGNVETRRSAVITLVSEVANAYLMVLSDQDLLRVTQDTLKSQQASYDLTRLRYDGDQATALDLRQAEISVRTAQADLAAYRRQVGQDRNALALLLGAAIPVDLATGGGIDGQLLLEDLPAGIPSEVLALRPDVLAAEHQLIAASANIGAARAAFFPSVALTGSYGTSSLGLSELFASGSSAWSFLPQVTLPIFTGGANEANLAYAKEERNLYVATYEKIIQTAFQEVSNALLSRDTLLDQLAAQLALEAASRDAYRLSDMRFQAGIDNYLAVLESQRIFYAAQQSVVSVKLSRLQNLVTLYKALGGGWNEWTVTPQRPADPGLEDSP
jgi:multidrug efflux system outer membrane protein